MSDGDSSAKPFFSERSWIGLRSEYSELPPHEGATTTKPYQIGVSFSSHKGLVQCHDGRERELDVAPGAAFVTSTAPITWHRVQEASESLEIYPEPALLESLAETPFRSIDIRPCLGARDAVVTALATVVRRAHTGGMLSDVEGSEVAVRLAHHLLAHYSNTPPPTERFASRLDARRLTRVVDLIERDLATRIGLPALAAAAGMSAAHFSRCFKRTTGMTPHAFVTARRLDRAKSMRLRSALTVEEIAEAVGFSNISHFRRLFKAEFGVLPSGMPRGRSR